jgi:ParB family chromosome partitioning protein
MTSRSTISLNVARDVPFNKLVLSQANVRRIKAGVSVEELAEDIARRGLLQSLGVRPVVDASGVETGLYEVPAGGRRYRALERLVKAKRLAKTAPVPCVVKPADAEPSAAEDSLAENIQRAPLHPLDQFRAFLTLREQGRSEEEIAAAFFVGVGVVKQRLRLASVSPRLLDVYAEDGMTLDQLMAFTVSGDHERQEQAFERLRQAYSKEPHVIRRMLTEGAVRMSDKRAQFIDLEAYVEAGGVVLHDLFQGDDGGWLRDVALVERMVVEKLEREAEAVRTEGWRWIEVAPDFPYGHTYGLRQLRGEAVPLTDEEEATLSALQQEVDDIEAASAEAEELTDAQDQRMGELETAIEALNDHPVVFDTDDVGHAGAFVSIDGSGALRIERGYVRLEDEQPVEPEVQDFDGDHQPHVAGSTEHDAGAPTTAAASEEPEEDEGLKPIPDRLMTELTAHRTLALRHALGEHPKVAFLAALHVLSLRTFYYYGQDSCLELDLKSAGFTAQAPGLADSASAKAVNDRHQAWANALPKEPSELWDALTAFDGDSRQALFAHCVSLSVNAVYESYNRKPRALTHADRLAGAVDLDMVAAGWRPTVETYLGRVTKARILAAVREAKGTRAGDRIEHLKKGEMAEQAQVLLENSGWLPEPLRTLGRDVPAPGEDVGGIDPPGEDDAVEPHAIAAE